MVCHDLLVPRSPRASRNISTGGLLAASSVLLVALASCGSDDADTREPHARPTSAGECSDLPMLGADPGMVLGSDWSPETHPYDLPVDLTVCVTTADDGSVRVRSSDAGITVTPRTQPVPATGNGLLTVQVRVASGTPSGATLRLVQDGGGGVFGDTIGPLIVTAADGWHFAGS